MDKQMYKLIHDYLIFSFLSLSLRFLCSVLCQGEVKRRFCLSGGASEQPHPVDGEPGCPQRRSQGRDPALPPQGGQLRTEVSLPDNFTNNFANWTCVCVCVCDAYTFTHMYVQYGSVCVWDVAQLSVCLCVSLRCLMSFSPCSHTHQQYWYKWGGSSSVEVDGCWMLIGLSVIVGRGQTMATSSISGSMSHGGEGGHWASSLRAWCEQLRLMPGVRMTQRQSKGHFI